MDNHVHLLVKTGLNPLGAFIGRVNGMYAKYFNNKYNYIGHLFQDRYYTELVEDDDQMLESSRYIHLNPVRAKMIKLPEDYIWSSCSLIFNKDDGGKLLDINLILSYFRENNSNLYKEFIYAAIKDYKISEDENNGISS